MLRLNAFYSLESPKNRLRGPKSSPAEDYCLLHVLSRFWEVDFGEHVAEVCAYFFAWVKDVLRVKDAF